MFRRILVYFFFFSFPSYQLGETENGEGPRCRYLTAHAVNNQEALKAGVQKTGHYFPRGSC